MSTELWIKDPCKHGKTFAHLVALADWDEEYGPKSCPGGYAEVLDPKQVLTYVETGIVGDEAFTVQDVLDALEKT